MDGPSRWTCGPSSSESSPFPYHGQKLTLRASSVNLPPDCINLGQGYMNFPPPVWARDAAEEALRSVEGNHYAPAKGRLRLRKAIKEFYGTEFRKELDPDTEIIVTSGANEGALCLLARRTTVVVPANLPPYIHIPPASLSLPWFELSFHRHAEHLVMQGNTPRSRRSSSRGTKSLSSSPSSTSTSRPSPSTAGNASTSPSTPAPSPPRTSRSGSSPGRSTLMS